MKNLGKIGIIEESRGENSNTEFTFQIIAQKKD